MKKAAQVAEGPRQTTRAHPGTSTTITINNSNKLLLITIIMRSIINLHRQVKVVYHLQVLLTTIMIINNNNQVTINNQDMKRKR